MGRKNIIAGLEIGRTKINMAAVEAKNGGIDFLGASTTKCPDGLKNGTVVNLDDITEAVLKLTEEISQKSSKKINLAMVNISGLNIYQEIAGSVITLPHRGCEITQRHVDDLIEACKIVSVPLDRHLLYIYPLEYIIDGQGGIKKPVGLCGNKFEGRILIVTAPFNQVQNIIKAANFAGVEIGSVVMTTLANSCSMLSEEEKNKGVLLIDFKTDLSEVSIFREGKLLFFKVIPKGQADLTDAIASRFDIPVESAEELKVGYGFISGPSDNRDQENIPVECMGNNKNIPRGEINKVISERLGVIFNLISEEVKNFSGFKDIVKAGAVITGGCTYMEGFLEGATERLGFSVRQGTLNQVFGISAETYAVSLGLVKFGLQTREVIDGKSNMGIFKKVFQKTNEILTDYF